MTLHYTFENIQRALRSLATEDGSLRDRVSEAHRYLLRVSNTEGFEEEFTTIRECLSSVENENYNDVEESELKIVATTIMDMFEKIPRE